MIESLLPRHRPLGPLPIGALANMAAPDTQRGERGAVWAVGLLRPCRCHGPRCHRDLVLSGGWPAWWGCGPPAQPSALALQQPVHGGDTDGSCRTTVGRHGPHPRGVSGYHPAAENAVTAVLAGRFLRPRPFRGLRGRMRTVFGCSPTSPIGLLASMAAPDAQRGERGAGGLLPAFSRSDGRKPVSSRLGQPDSAPRTAAGGRRWSSIRAAVILSEQQLAAV